MVDDNIIRFIKFLEESIIKNWNKVIGLVSLIASILTIIGKTLPSILIKPQNWKERKAIRYSILNSINELEDEKFILFFAIRVLRFIILYITLFVTMYIFSYWITDNRFKSNTEGYFLVLLSLCTYVLYKTKNRKKFLRIPLITVYIVLLNFFILKEVIIYNYPNNGKLLIKSIIIICICNYIIVEYIFSWSKIDNAYRLKWKKKFKFCKVFFASVYILLLFYCPMRAILMRKNLVVEEIIYQLEILTVIFITLWMILCYIEIKIDYGRTVEFKINKKDAYEVTRKAVLQCECEKVKYVSDDGCIRFVGEEEIESIDYMIKNFTRKPKKVNVTCILKNNNVLNFDGYNFIKDSWISFYKLSENKKEIKIINIKKIKEIIVKKL